MLETNSPKWELEWETTNGTTVATQYPGLKYGTNQMVIAIIDRFSVTIMLDTPNSREYLRKIASLNELYIPHSNNITFLT